MIQIWARLPESLYQAFQDYLDETGQKKTQAIVYAIANYIQYHSRNMNNTDSLSLKIDDLKIDVEDIEGFLEDLDKRLLRLERKNQESLTTYKLTDYDKLLISRFTKNCHKAGSVFSIKDLLYIIRQDPDEQGLQMQVAHFLKSQGWEKKRRKFDGKHKYIWVKDSNE